MVSFDISRTLLFYIFLCLLSLNTEAAVVFLDYDCYPNTTTNYTRNSSYHRNLNFLLSSLQSNSTRENGFYNLTVGQHPPDIVYGLFLCRGDVTKETCQECVTTASGEILRRCPNQKAALIFYEECTLRYLNRSFFSVWEREPSLQLLNTGDVSQPDRFMHLLGNTMNEIATRAANDQSGKKYATEEANFTSFQNLYTLAQCTPDLSASNCDTCLQTAISFLPSCCLGKQGGRVVFPSCNVRYELYPFYRITAQPPSPTPVVLPSPPAPKSKEKNRVSSTIIIAIVVPVVISVVLFVVGFFCVLTRKRKKCDAVEQENDGSKTMAMESLQFDLSITEAATNNFAEANKVGAGGFGSVYKGTLPNGQEIAVKRLSTSSGQGAGEFQTEVLLVAKLQHRNLVKLLGYCLERKERMIIYEFVPNKSLDYFIFDPEKQRQLDWPKRYKIIKGIARGLLYLHSDSRLKIIHRDLKAGNILLDEDMTPKISDFGMAKIVGENISLEHTERIVGTYGYMSPEYAIHGRFSEKSDVFSFGILILEIVCGKKNTSFCHSEYADNLLTYAWRRWKDGTPIELMDSTLQDSYVGNEVLRCIQIGLLCVQENPEARPRMARVVLMLSSSSVSLPLPQKTAFFFGTVTGRKFSIGEKKSDLSTSASSSATVNEASITELFPR